MKNRIILFFLVFISLSGHYLSNAQDVAITDSVFSKADGFYNLGIFEHAALEYERVIFENQESGKINDALFRRVRCFKQMKQFEKASNELSRVKIYSLDSIQLANYYYEKILCYYLQGSFSEALSVIDEMYLNMQDSAACNATLRLQVFVYNELREWEQAKKTALFYAHTHLSPQKDSIELMVEELYSNKNLPKLKSEKTSKVLAFVPGLAHIYAGYWVEGSVSFLLNVSVLAFGVYEVYTGYYLTGYLVGAGILSATYLGSVDRASFLVQKHNYKITRLFNGHVKDELLKF